MGDKEVANTIYQQLGGQKFAVMTGAKDFMADKNALIFSLPKGLSRKGIRRIKITLTPQDTYEVAFWKIGSAPSFKVEKVASYDGVYADNLRGVFTSTTGLETSLGTMRPPPMAYREPAREPRKPSKPRSSRAGTVRKGR